jgi:3'-phosphoadenosine 5'-phosphosulfate sulfotransferase
MGQKTNVLTLRKNKIENLNLNSESTKFFLYGFFFIKHFEKLLLRKGIILASKILNYENGQINIQKNSKGLE